MGYGCLACTALRSVLASGKTSRHRVKQASKQAAGFANQGTQETREKETNNRPCTYKTIVSCTYKPAERSTKTVGRRRRAVAAIVGDGDNLRFHFLERVQSWHTHSCACGQVQSCQTCRGESPVLSGSTTKYIYGTYDPCIYEGPQSPANAPAPVQYSARCLGKARTDAAT